MDLELHEGTNAHAMRPYQCSFFAPLSPNEAQAPDHDRGTGPRVSDSVSRLDSTSTARHKTKAVSVKRKSTAHLHIITSEVRRPTPLMSRRCLESDVRSRMYRCETPRRRGHYMDDR